jgi:hypothetical protein
MQNKTNPGLTKDEMFVILGDNRRDNPHQKRYLPIKKEVEKYFGLIDGAKYNISSESGSNLWNQFVYVINDNDPRLVFKGMLNGRMEELKLLHHILVEPSL